MSGTPANWRDHGVRVLRRDAIDRGDAQSLAAHRIATLTHAPPGVDTLAAHSLELAPDTTQPAHHHGPLETIICIISGQAVIRWGEHLEYFCSAGPGDLVIADSTVVDGSGVALVTELRRAGWSRAVVLGPSDDAAAVRTALAAGIHGFVVTQAERVAPRPLTGPVTIVTSNSPAATGPESLSDREIEVLRQVADGRSNRDVAESLGLSSLTVKSHLARIARKLGTGDRAEMVVMALRAGLID